MDERPDGEAPPHALAEHILRDFPDLGVVSVTARGLVGWWSDGAAKLTGRSARWVVGKPIASLWRTEAAEDLAGALDRAAEGVSTRHAGEALRPDGSRYWLEASFSGIRVPGSPVRYAVVLQDRSEENRAQDELRRSLAIFSGILAIAPDAVICTDDREVITFFNRGAEAIFGYGAEEVLGRSLDLLLPEAARGRHSGLIATFGDSPVHAKRKGERGEIAGRRKNGVVFPAEASISKLDAGDTRTYTVVLRDISERRRSEEAIAAKARELARSNAELEQFAYVASHDLREPLRMVASYTQLLARRYQGRLDADADEFIGYAVGGVLHMQELISDLLTYSRVSTRGFEREPVEMGGVLSKVLQSLGPAVEQADAMITSDPLPTVVGDRSQLIQLMQNLIANAIKFRGERSPTVHVTAARSEDAWTFAVQDNGIGIAPEFSERIFVIFQRLHGREEYPGTGIGLSICRKIVERHGGAIWFDSTVGQGTTFFFSLPDYGAGDDSTPDRMSRGSPSTMNPDPGTGRPAMRPPDAPRP